MTTHTNANEEIREFKNNPQAYDDVLRYFSADGHLYAYREDDKHIVVARGSSADWVKRVPAERKAVLAGERLWTIPDNWEHRARIADPADGRKHIYHIPETGVSVIISEPDKVVLSDAWLTVRRVGKLTVNYDDEIDWDQLPELLDILREIEEVSDDVVEVLDTINHQREAFETHYADNISGFGSDVLFDGEMVRLDGMSGINPWRDSINLYQDLYEFFRSSPENYDRETLESAAHELDDGGIVPTYPNLRVDVDNGEGLSEDYNIRALVDAGVSGAEIVDYLITEYYNTMTQTEWAKVRGKSQSAISKNVSGAKRKVKATYND